MPIALGTRHNLNDKTETEILQERAGVLGRAGEALSQALQQMQIIGERIRVALAAGIDSEDKQHAVNLDIQHFNRTREHAKLRYYYLIVTREAMGFRSHNLVDEAYPIPPRIEPLMRMEWTGTKNKD